MKRKSGLLPKFESAQGTVRLACVMSLHARARVCLRFARHEPA